MTSFLKSAVASALLLAGAAQASSITYQTGTAFGPSQASAAAYKAVVEVALAQPGALSATVPTWANLSNQGVFGNTVFNNNIASRVTVNFGVSAANAGAWNLRFGGDFGYGAAVFLDGVALGFSASALWWQGSWADPAQILQFTGVVLTPGNHTLQFFGLEDCCDSGQQGQFSIGSAPYITFGTADGLPSVVPEPAAQALLAAGLGVTALVANRRRRS